MKFRIALLSATMIAAPLALAHVASAQPVTGPYVSLEGGYNWTTKTKAKDFVVGGVGAPGSARLSFFGGPSAEASVGYGFGDGFRVELEGDYMNNNFDRTTFTFAQYKSTGHEQKYGGFVNGYYDFALTMLPMVTPYVGAGVGYQIVNATNYTAGPVFVSQPRGSFAYQGIAGLAIPITPVPGLDVTVEYRFIGLTGSEKYHGNAFGVPVSYKLLHQYNNEIMGGVRYQLFQPQPPAPPPAPAAPVAAPAPAPAKTYLVFFDWDKSSLTPRATDIIAQAAADSKTQQTTTIAVNGYTDTSGSPTYNQGLSVRRANAVAAQLVADGVPSSEITAQGFGDTNLLVATGPGVREPQNRRVQNHSAITIDPLTPR